MWFHITFKSLNNIYKLINTTQEYIHLPLVAFKIIRLSTISKNKNINGQHNIARIKLYSIKKCSNYVINLKRKYIHADMFR